MSVLLIPRTTPGLTIRPLRKIAGQAVHTCEIFFDDARVPGNALLGEVDHGASILFALLNGERIALGAHGVGIAQGRSRPALKHASQREQFGQPVADFQAVGHMLADMAMDIEAARLLVYQAAWKKQNGLPHSMDASMAKVRGSEAGSRCAGRGMEIIGGGSYLVDFGMERYLPRSETVRDRGRLQPDSTQYDPEIPARAASAGITMSVDSPVNWMP